MFADGLQIIYRWFADGLQMVCRWFTDGLGMVYRWFTVSVKIVDIVLRNLYRMFKDTLKVL